MWITLEGIDGAGKTTLAKGLCERIPGATLYPRRDFQVTSEYVAAAQRHLAAIMWGIGDSQDLSPSFWLYLQGAWHVLAVEGRAMPDIAIADGWFYKFLARLVAQGFELNALVEVMRFVAHPDLVILLNVDPSEAWTRKKYRSTELGLHQTAQALGKQSFISYQRATYLALRQIGSLLRGWITVDIAPGQTIDETLQTLTDHLDHHVKFTQAQTTKAT